jgi:hypothetical protein
MSGCYSKNTNKIRITVRAINSPKVPLVNSQVVSLREGKGGGGNPVQVTEFGRSGRCPGAQLCSICFCLSR